MLLISAPTASADHIRDMQWVLDAAEAEAIWLQSQGEGVIVAVVDTGVKASHPDLTGQVLKGIDITTGGYSPHTDVNGNGTHMASIIAGHGHGPGARPALSAFQPDWQEW